MKTVLLGDVCELTRGPFGGSLKKTIFKSDGYAVYEQRNAIYNQFDARYFIDENKFNEMKRFELNPGDLIMSCSGTMGKVAIVPTGTKKGIINQALLKIKPSPRVDVHFLKLWMESEKFQEALAAHSQGAAIQNVASVKILKSIIIDLPAVEEQRQVIEKLDKAFAVIDKAKQNTEKNLQNSREIFSSELNRLYSVSDTNWSQDILKNLTTKIGSGSTPRGGKHSYIQSGTALIRSMNVHDYAFKEKNLAFINDDQARKLNNVIIETGDVLLNITGASVARCCLAPGDVLPARVNQHVAILRPIDKFLDPAFLHYLLISKVYKDRLLKTGAGGGSTRQAITKAQLQNFKIEYPDIDEQKKIVEVLNNLSQQTHKLQELYRKKLAALEELRQSILKQAFEGKL